LFLKFKGLFWALRLDGVKLAFAGSDFKRCLTVIVTVKSLAGIATYTINL